MMNKQIRTLSVTEYGATYLAELKRQQWYKEIDYAAKNTSGAELASLAGRAVGHFGWAGRRRISNFADLGKATIKFSEKLVQEGKNAYRAVKEDRFTTHIGERYDAVAEFSNEKWNASKNLLTEIRIAYERDPTHTIVQLICISAGFTVGSGGLDGNGGVPDLDISMFGIGQHRSILTHSIISGMAIETIAMVTVDAVALIYKKLPATHDPFWDKLFAHQQRIIQALAQGASLGIAYHLCVDGIVQPAPYHDLPFSMPIEGHQAVLVVNAAAEGMSTVKSQEPHEPSLSVMEERSSESVRVVKIGDALRCANCKYTKNIQQTWLRMVNDRLSNKRPGSVLDSTTLVRLKCKGCGVAGKVGIVDIPPLELTIKEQARESDNSTKVEYCSRCRGTGGAGGRCFACGGSGWK